MSEEWAKELARVESVSLEIEDHGILTCYVNLNKESGLHQSFGGYSLDTYDEDLKKRIGTASGMDWVLRILNIFGVSKLEDIEGKMCYAVMNGQPTIQGLETLKIDGGKTFMISDWRKQWGFPEN